MADHLGRRLASFGSYVSTNPARLVMVRLAARRADMFSVSVMSPKQGGRELAGAMGKCPTAQQRKRMGGDMKEFTCHRLQNGTTVTPTWFRPASATQRTRSRRHGSVVAPDKSTTMAMYESYDKTSAASPSPKSTSSQ